MQDNKLIISLITDIERLKEAKAILQNITELSAIERTSMFMSINRNIEILTQKLDDLKEF